MVRYAVGARVFRGHCAGNIGAGARARWRSCGPVSERAGEVGRWIIAHVRRVNCSTGGFLAFGHVSDRTEAEAAKGPRGTVVEALGKVWLFTIEEAGWRPSGGVRVAEIGPLHVKSGEKYTARYMEVIFTPGMMTP